MVVKAATNWALYALDGALSGDWSTAGLMTPNGKNQAGVSHISLYNSAAPVPLPAAGWLLIAGLGGTRRACAPPQGSRGLIFWAAQILVRAAHLSASTDLLVFGTSTSSPVDSTSPPPKAEERSVESIGTD